MKRVVSILLVLACLFALSACSNKGQDYLNAKVIEITENEIIVECIDEATNQLTGSRLSVSKEVVSADGIPQIKIGHEIRVVFDFDSVSKLDDPVRINQVYAIYLLDKNREIITEKCKEVVETIIEDFATYHKMSDGTWETDTHSYKYRFEITGRMNNAIADITFVYLSNVENISFDRAWKGSGLSSNLEDYFSEEEAVLVDMIVLDSD